MTVKHSPSACVSKAELFHSLPESMRKKLVPITTHRQYFPKGSLIRRPFDGQNGMLVIDQGSAKVYNLNDDGKETVLGLLKKGDIEGQQNLFSTDAPENFIEALQDTWVCSLKGDDFQNLLKQTPDLALKMLNNFGQMLVTAERNSVRRNSLDAKSRIMAHLHDLAKSQASNIVTLKLKKKDLASYLGITPETFSRQLKVLAKEKKIAVHGKKIEILDK